MIRKVVTGLLGLALLGCDDPKSKSVTNMNESETKRAAASEEYGAYVHSVYVWLANPENEEERIEFETAMKNFINDLPYAQLFHFGRVIPSERAVVDSSYDYSFIVVFNSEEDMKQYEIDPAHLNFLSETKSLIERIRIFDSRDLME